MQCQLRRPARTRAASPRYETPRASSTSRPNPTELILAIYPNLACVRAFVRRRSITSTSIVAVVFGRPSTVSQTKL